VALTAVDTAMVLLLLSILSSEKSLTSVLHYRNTCTLLLLWQKAADMQEIMSTQIPTQEPMPPHGVEP